MKSFETKWNDLATSDSAATERTRVEALQTFARDNNVHYQLAVVEAEGGAPIPVASLGSLDAARAANLLVKVTADANGKKVNLTWRPRDPANVLVLLRE